MTASVASLWRHPVKGFTPERLASATLAAGGYFPCDRIYAVENGPSGFDPAAPAWLPKGKFTVLAKIAEVARVRTAYDEASGVLSARADGQPAFSGTLAGAQGRAAFAEWLTGLLGDEARGPLGVVRSPEHRFTDHPDGHVSIVNLASVRDLAAKLGVPVNPLRFRANLYVEGWPAWVENEATGFEVRLGAVRTLVFQPIVRCAATHVDPITGERDIDIVGGLHHHFGHLCCGIYVSVVEGGTVHEGDGVEIAPPWLD
jgi:hypothetical protein